MIDERDWCVDHTNVAALYRWLDGRNELPDDVSYFIANPWKWTPEWKEMQTEVKACVGDGSGTDLNW